MITPPPIDPRLPSDLAEQTRRFLCTYLSGAPYTWQPDDDGGEAGRAITQVFAAYCGLVIERLNRAPQKNYLAFLDLLGNSLVPAEPARATLTFFLDPAAGGQGALLPANTAVQAEPPPGTDDTIVFETERDLALTTVSLVSIQKGATSLSGLIYAASAPGEAVFETLAAYVFGFSLPAAVPPGVVQTVEMYFLLDSPAYDPASPGFSVVPAPLTWERAPAVTGPWQRLLVEDETESLTRSGPVRFQTPPESGWEAPTGAGERRFWLRVNPPAAVYRPPPRLRGVALNTVPALHAVTVTDEVLGSSNGNPDQTFTMVKKPVQPGQTLTVRERQEWVTWDEVTDFHGSTPLDRHYVIDRQAGRVRFGDGVRGMIPPAGGRNVRMAKYRSGGGAAGNLPAGAIRTLVSGSKQIARVTNLVPAAGGADAETIESLVERAPTGLRHRQRAVTQQDYEDLARLASPEVARALCVPLQDLAAEPYRVVRTIPDEAAGVGKVSVVIVPRSAAARPLPSGELMRRVQSYLAERASEEAAVSVVGPLYLSVNVAISIKLTSMLHANRVERELQERFAAFLHPLTGSLGSGWPFGRRPYESDVYRLIADVEGVRYASALTIALAADDPARRADIENTGRFLVYSGTHTITFDLT